MPNDVERTFVIIKPDAVRRGLVGEIISHFERKGLKIVAMKMIRMSKEQAETLYAPHKGKSFYEGLIKFMTSSPCIVMILEGLEAVEQTRKLIGSTDCKRAEPGTIRFKYGLSTRFNLIHASDSLESFERESKIFFSESELNNYYLSHEEYLRDK